MAFFEPVYIKTYEKGLLKDKVEKANKNLNNCQLCPRKCNADRLSGQVGICKTAEYALVSSCQLHFGEEAPLVGKNGSGTIFFTHCNLLCSFCQNYDISHEGRGMEVSDIELAGMMLSLQKSGCHNINFVTPSHVVPQILSALEKAIEKGLNLPLVYNTGGYDNVSTLKLLEGVFDIYMPDFKFWNDEISELICKTPDYPEIARNAIKEMHRQVGDLFIDNSGLAKRGLLIRHLVLPYDLAGTRGIMGFLFREISPDTYVNVMSQYRPCGNAYKYDKLSHPLSLKDYKIALLEAREEGITRLDKPGFWEIF